jgi:chromosome segregation ATPase
LRTLDARDDGRVVAVVGWRRAVADDFQENLGPRVSALETRFAAEAEAVTQHFTELKDFISFTVTSQIADVRQDLRRVEQRLDGRIDRLERQIGGLTTRFDGLEGKVEGLTERFDRLERKVEGHDLRFDAIERRLDGHDLRFDAIERRLDGHDLRFDAIDRRLDGHDLRFDAIDRRLDGHDQRFDALDLKTDAHHAAVKLILSEILDRLPAHGR